MGIWKVVFNFVFRGMRKWVRAISIFELLIRIFRRGRCIFFEGIVCVKCRSGKEYEMGFVCFLVI